MPSELLIVFTRYPRPGEAKTRLAGVLGTDGAAELHRRLAEHAVEQARGLAAQRGARLEVHCAGGEPHAMRRWLGRDLDVRPQTGHDLGARLRQAFTAAFEGGATEVIIMGTDCPDLTAQVLAGAFVALERNDLVLGPAMDGGYYLIGLTRAAPQLFDGIDWGTGTVLATTQQTARELGLTVGMLDRLEDVDRPEDLVRAQAFLGGPASRA